jgi:hypothetical protein
MAGKEREMSWRPSGLCSMFICDVVSFGNSARTDHARIVIRKVLYTALRMGFDKANVPYAGCHVEDRGDGVMVIVPPTHPVPPLITVVIDWLRAEIRRHNQVSNTAAQMQLRVAVHAGWCESDGNGLVGEALNHAFRILEAAPLKEALKESTTEVGLIVSQRVYEDVVRHSVGLVNPTDYREVAVQVKETDKTAWISVPGTSVSTPAPLATGPELAPQSDQVLITTELVDRMLEIPLMAQERGREQVLRALPDDIAWRIPRAPDARSDTYNIIRTCLEYPGAFQQLHQAIKYFAGESFAVHRLEGTIVRLLTAERDG